MAAGTHQGTHDRAQASASGGCAQDAPQDTPCRDTLYYDGQCPLCASEIDALRQTRGEAICLVDIHTGTRSARADSADGSAKESGSTPPAGSSGSTASAPGREQAPSKDQLLRTLHLQRADGSWLTGADANVAAWEGTAQERRLRLLRWPVLRHVVDFAYTLWAKWRYWRLYGRQFDEARHAPDQTGH